MYQRPEGFLQETLIRISLQQNLQIKINSGIQKGPGETQMKNDPVFLHGLVSRLLCDSIHLISVMFKTKVHFLHFHKEF